MSHGRGRHGAGGTKLCCGDTSGIQVRLLACPCATPTCVLLVASLQPHSRAMGSTAFLLLSHISGSGSGSKILLHSWGWRNVEATELIRCHAVIWGEMWG